MAGRPGPAGQRCWRCSMGSVHWLKYFTATVGLTVSSGAIVFGLSATTAGPSTPVGACALLDVAALLAAISCHVNWQSDAE